MYGARTAVGFALLLRHERLLVTSARRGDVGLEVDVGKGQADASTKLLEQELAHAPQQTLTEVTVVLGPTPPLARVLLQIHQLRGGGV